MKLLSAPMKSYLAVSVVMLVFSILLPANRAAMASYHLSATNYHILIFLLIIPLLGVWFAAFYGYSELKRYAVSISDAKEGKYFSQIATGLYWLAWSLPLIAILTLVLGSVVNVHPGFRPMSEIIISYATLIFPFIAFLLLNNGSRGLIDYMKIRISVKGLRMLVTLFVVIGVVYCYLTFQQLDLHSSTSSQNPFYLPNWLVVGSMTIPYLIAWFTGLLSTYEIFLYGKQAHGILYRQPTLLVAAGISILIIGSISLQYLTSIQPASSALQLNGALVTSYLMQFVEAAGYIAITYGSLRLRRIEEV